MSLNYEDVIAKLETAVVDSPYELSADIARLVGTWEVTGIQIPNYPLYSKSVDAALTLLPESAISSHLTSFVGHGREDVNGHCWAFQIHDQSQLMGVQRAKYHIQCLKLPFRIGSLPYIAMEKAISEQFCQFGATHAATPAIAICLTALKCKIGRTVDDDLWPRLVRIER